MCGATGECKGAWETAVTSECINSGNFEINYLLFADYTALVADSEEKLCKLLSEFGRVCERRNLTVNVGKSKVIRCLRYGNVGRMHV